MCEQTLVLFVFLCSRNKTKKGKNEKKKYNSNKGHLSEKWKSSVIHKKTKNQQKGNREKKPELQ